LVRPEITSQLWQGYADTKSRVIFARLLNRADFQSIYTCTPKFADYESAGN